jgi:DNA topoisomerase-3
MDNVKKFTILIVNKVRLQPRAAKEAFTRVSTSAQAKSAPSKSTTAKKATAKSATTAQSHKKSESRTQKLSRESITTCPRTGCGGQIFMGNKGYGCSHYKEGCSFVIWKSSFGKSLTPVMVKTLIEKGTTNRLKLTNEAGEVIDGKILLKDTNTGQLVIQ